MKRNVCVMETLERLAEKAPDVLLDDQETSCLRTALGTNSRETLTLAARIVAARRMVQFVPDLTEAFRRLLTLPSKADRGCLIKTALIEALNNLDCHEEAVFLRGVQFTQMEPSFGKSVDTAGLLRAHCALGLARISHPRAAHEILPLLVDSQPQARSAAVRALSYLGGDLGDLLLRMKALVGDEHPAIIGECLTSLVKMDPASAVPFVRRFLDSPDLAIVEEAAMALAEASHPEVAAILCACRSARPDQRFREMMLLPIAMTRSDAALDLLYDVIVDEPRDSAVAAIHATAIHRHDARWSARVKDAVSLREDPALLAAYSKEFAE